MTKEELVEIFREAMSSEIAFKGFCHDCKKPVMVLADLKDKIVISGGAVYNAGKPEKKLYLKCEECYNRDPTLRKFQPTEVYSRVVGYLRPVKQWNVGKVSEFEQRINYKLEVE